MGFGAAFGGGAPTLPKPKDKKKKKAVKSVAVKLEDSEVAEYENILAQVSIRVHPQSLRLFRG